MTGIARLATCAGALMMIAAASECAPNGPAVRAGVRDTLSRQAAAWNAGDIDGFMDGYERSDALTFCSGGQLRRGWNATRQRYLQRYGAREKMGALSFSEIEIRPLAPDAALVLGRWRLTFADQPSAGGRFSLNMARRDGRWLIIHDHTSSDVADQSGNAAPQ